MLANLFQLIARRTPPDDPHGFVEEVRVASDARVRNRRVEKVLLGCWLAITGKCWLVIWLIGKYHLALNPLWVNGPTVLFALLCTGVYYFRE
jgi:hypothetical protein